MNWFNKLLVTAKMLLLCSCLSTVDLDDACKDQGSSANDRIDCSAVADAPTTPAPTVPIVPTIPSIASFEVNGTVTGAGVNGKKIFCSTVEEVPIQQNQLLDGTGIFSLTFAITGEIPIRCIITDGADAYFADVVFTEAVTRSLKGNTSLNHLVVVRKNDTSTVNLGTITLTTSAATAPFASVSQNGVGAFVGSWTDFSGTWIHLNNLNLTSFANDMNGGRAFLSVADLRWNQVSTTDDLSASHTALSVWANDRLDTPALFDRCQGREGLNLPAGWLATLNGTALQPFSDPAINFSTAPGIANILSRADYNYTNVPQRICGVDLSFSTCALAAFPPTYAGLNQDQCYLLCVAKSIDAVMHFQTPINLTCNFEYKTDLTGNLAAKIPASGICTPANGDPCPGFIEKPQYVAGRGYFETVKIVADTASFQVVNTDTIRNCNDNNSDGDLLDASDCTQCSFHDTIAVVVRKLSANKAYITQRISRLPDADNDPFVCAVTGPMRDAAFEHRVGVLGLSEEGGTIPGFTRSHAYISIK